MLENAATPNSLKSRNRSGQSGLMNPKRLQFQDDVVLKEANSKNNANFEIGKTTSLNYLKELSLSKKNDMFEYG